MVDPQDLARQDRGVEQLTRAARRLERELEALQAERARLVAAVARAAPSTPLALAPLLWALAGILVALFGAVWAYIALLDLHSCGNNSCESQLFLATALGSLGLAAFSLFFSRRPGAGGAARRTLRLTTLIVGSGILAVLIYIGVNLALGRCPLILAGSCF